ncbi:MAG: hypothetical protein ACXU68_04645 [Croceibacterium sp.]
MMKGIVKGGVVGLAALAALALASPAAAQQGQCSRDTLQDVANRYVKAQHGGSVFALPVGEWVDYRENYQLVSTTTGVIGQPADFAWHLDLVDPGSCRVFVQGVILKPKPYVVGTALAWSFNGLGQINSVVTQAGDPQFDAQAASDAASKEDWGVIPAEKRDTRDALMAAANAYLAALPGPKLAEPELTIDDTKGAVAVRGHAGGPDGPAVGHVLRIESGKVRYDHALTPKG